MDDIDTVDWPAYLDAFDDADDGDCMSIDEAERMAAGAKCRPLSE